jgi:formate dehydrogenase subunit delta
MPPEKLVMMANQIGQFFATQPGGHAAADIADHLRRFWDPRMRKEIVQYLVSGGQGLDPPVAEAVRMLG